MKKETMILSHSPRPEDPTSFYRSEGPFGHLRKHSENPISFMFMDYAEHITWNRLRSCDILFMQRPSTKVHKSVIEMAKGLGKPVWIDYDDDLLSLQTDNPAYNIYGQVETQKTVTEIIDLADAVSVSTKALADNLTARGFKKDYVVIENAVDLKQFPWAMGAPPERKNTVMWRGSPSHFRDVLSVTPVLTNVINDSKDWMFEFMGDRLWFLTDKCDPSKTKFTLGGGIYQYHRYIYEQAPKVFIAPLIDTPFNRAKSNIAWLEATFAGAVCVCKDLPEWKHFGPLHYSDPANFRSLLLMAMEMSPEEHKKMVSASWEVIVEKYNMDTQNQKRERIIKDLV